MCVRRHCRRGIMEPVRDAKDNALHPEQYKFRIAISQQRAADNKRNWRNRRTRISALALHLSSKSVVLFMRVTGRTSAKRRVSCNHRAREDQIACNKRDDSSYSVVLIAAALFIVIQWDFCFFFFFLFFHLFVFIAHFSFAEDTPVQ